MKYFLPLLAAALAVFPLAAAPENLARGCQYTMTPPPNHALCTGAEDATDLTDGKFTVKQPMALDQGAVGWRIGRSPEVCIVVDLGAVKRFSRVTFSTGGGSNSISYPDFINVEASTDGLKFYQLGSLTALSKNPWPPVDAGYRNLVLDADFQTVEARYVRLRCVVSGLFMFCDEIEVYAADAPPVELQSLPPALESEEFLRSLPALIIESCIRRSYSTLLGKIKKRLGDPELSAQASVLEKRIEQWKLPGKVEDFKAVYPIDQLHRDIFLLNAANSKLKGLAVWETAVYDPLDALAEPAAQAETHLQAAMMNNERRMAAVNLRGGGLKPVEVTAVLKNLPGRIYRTELLDANSLLQTSTVLSQVEGGFTVYPGLASQLVLEFAPDNLPAGENRGVLELSCEGERREIPITLTIAKERFPDKTTLSSGTWDYLEFSPQPLQRKAQRWPGAALRDIQKEHLIKVTFGYHILGGACHPQRYLGTDELDFSGFDNWIKNWPDAENYVLFFSIKADSKPNGLTPGSPEFNAAVKKWAERWDRHLETSGLVNGKVIFQIIDEPRHEKDYAVLQHWIKAVKSGSRHIALFNNPLRFEAKYAKYLEGSDILCPVVALMLDYSSVPAAALRKSAASGGKLWLYRCSAGPFNTDPGYYRNQAWLAYRNNAVGSMFWALGDIGREPHNGRNQYLTRPIYYAPLIFDDGRINLTKHLKAIRDGIQDYEYLVILNRMINSAENTGADTARAKALIREALLKLTQSPSLGLLNPDGSSPASTAEKYRLDILRQIDRGFD